MSMNHNARMRAAHALRAALLATGILLLEGCNGDASGPNGIDETGRIEALILDDPQGPATDVSPNATWSSASGFAGDLQADVQVSISADGDAWIDLGPLHRLTVGLQSLGGEASVSGQQSVSAGTYSHVRLVMDNATAQLLAGSTVGGLTLAVDTSVGVGSGDRVEVEFTVPPFTVGGQSIARVMFDLNSESWLTETAVTLGSASSAQVAANLSAEVMTPN